MVNGFVVMLSAYRSTSHDFSLLFLNSKTSLQSVRGIWILDLLLRPITLLFNCAVLELCAQLATSRWFVFLRCWTLSILWQNSWHLRYIDSEQCSVRVYYLGYTLEVDCGNIQKTALDASDGGQVSYGETNSPSKNSVHTMVISKLCSVLSLLFQIMIVVYVWPKIERTMLVSFSNLEGTWAFGQTFPMVFGFLECCLIVECGT